MLAWTLCASAAAAPAEPSASPEAVEFDDQFLRQPGGPAIDLSRFNKGNVALPGFYTAELYANEGWIGRVQLQLRQVGREVQPCFDRALVERIGVDPSKLLLQPVAPAE